MKSIKKLLVLSLTVLLSLPLTSCRKEEKIETDLESARIYLKQMYQNTTTTDASYTVVSALNLDSIIYTIDWDIVIDNNNTNLVTIGSTSNGKTTINVNRTISAPTIETSYKLTYTIKDPNGDKVTGLFDRKVTVLKTNTWSECKTEAKANKQAKTMNFEGKVINKGVYSDGYADVTVANSYGGFLVPSLTFASEEDFNNLKLGSSIVVTGKMETKYGCYQFVKNSTYTLMQASNEDSVTYKDLSTTVSSLTYTSSSLANYNYTAVTIKGAVIGDFDSSSDNKYYGYFTIGSFTSYVRISTNGSYLYEDGDKEDLQTLWENNKGKEVDIKGIMNYFNGYYIQLSKASTDFIDIKQGEVSDQTKCDIAITNAVKQFNNYYGSNPELNLLTNDSDYSDVSYSYEITSGSTYASITNNKLNLAFDSDEHDVVINVTASLNSASKSSSVTIHMIKGDKLDLNGFVSGSYVKEDAATVDSVVSNYSYIDVLANGCIQLRSNSAYGTNDPQQGGMIYNNTALNNNLIKVVITPQPSGQGTSYSTTANIIDRLVIEVADNANFENAKVLNGEVVDSTVEYEVTGGLYKYVRIFNNSSYTLYIATVQFVY